MLPRVVFLVTLVGCSTGASETTEHVEATANKSPSSEPGGAGRRPERQSSEPTHAIPVDPADASEGPADAWVTLVFFWDFEPFSDRVRPTFAKLRHKFPEDLRIVYKHYPQAFRHSLEAHHLACMAAAQGRFFDALDHVFERRREVAEGEIAAKLLVDFVVDDDLTRRRCQEKVARHMNEAKRFNVRGTPVSLVNGHMLSGAQPLDVFERKVQAELSYARDSRVDRSDYYRQVVLGQTGLAEAPIEAEAPEVSPDAASAPPRNESSGRIAERHEHAIKIRKDGSFVVRGKPRTFAQVKRDLARLHKRDKGQARLVVDLESGAPAASISQLLELSRSFDYESITMRPAL